jgi:uncharacterized protein with GYD domain
MATFVVLGCFTDQGIRGVRDTAKRAEAFQQKAKKVGATVKDVYWTLGQYDVVAVCDAPDDATASALVYSLAAQGNVRTETLRAFAQAEIGAILSKMV